MNARDAATAEVRVARANDTPSIWDVSAESVELESTEVTVGDLRGRRSSTERGAMYEPSVAHLEMCIAGTAVVGKGAFQQ